ncbi:MAG: PilZ domain-containing protein [Deltaproteobacteria bacterium]|nr:PilZ domain-containing protein [Deltaproteobacteria bacterium]
MDKENAPNDFGAPAQPAVPARAGGGTFLLVGDVTESQAAAVRRAAGLAGDELFRESTVSGALAWIDANERRPTAIGLAMGPDGATRQAIELRESFALAGVPVIGLVRDIVDLAFEDAFSSGLDEVCSYEDALLARRLRLLGEIDPKAVKRLDSAVVIADPDRETRLLIARVFRDAGYNVAFALDADEAVRQSLEPKTLAVIISASMVMEGSELLAMRAKKEGCHVPWIVNTPPKEIPNFLRLSLQAAVSGATVSVHDAFAAPASLLFVTNDLLSKHMRDGRRSERLLYGTSLRFRLAGRGNEDVGYVYNISEGGLYVRTLAPPARWDELWIEFTPPRSDRLVHLDATCVWARKYGPAGTASVPPGFGVEITGGSKADLGRYERCYAAYQDERQASRESIMPPALDLPPVVIPR